MERKPILIEQVVSGPLLRTIVAMWTIGFTLALGTAVLANSKRGIGAAAPYALAAILLSAVTVGAFKRARWALMVSVALLGLQIIGVLGTSIELVRGVSRLKAAELEPLGIDPVLAVWANLIYSFIASLIFVWFALRYRASRPTSNRPPPGRV